MKNIYLIGMMGSGKTVIAEEIGRVSEWKTVDLDALVVSDTRRTIKEIFAKQGEEYFRDLESNVLYDVHKLENLVVATGGGIVLRNRNIALMRRSGLVVYIERTPDEIISTIDAGARPLLASNPEKVRDIYRERRSLYERAAHIIIHNDRTVEDAANRVLSVSSLRIP